MNKAEKARDAIIARLDGLDPSVRDTVEAIVNEEMDGLYEAIRREFRLSIEHNIKILEIATIHHKGTELMNMANKMRNFILNREE